MDIISDGPTLVLSGDFDVRSTWEVRAAIYDALEGHDEDVVIDLSEVDDRRRHRAPGARRGHRAGRAATVTTSRCAAAGPAVRRMLHLSHLIRSSRSSGTAASRA